MALNIAKQLAEMCPGKEEEKRKEEMDMALQCTVYMYCTTQQHMVYTYISPSQYIGNSQMLGSNPIYFMSIFIQMNIFKGKVMIIKMKQNVLKVTTFFVIHHFPWPAS